MRARARAPAPRRAATRIPLRILGAASGRRRPALRRDPAARRSAQGWFLADGTLLADLLPFRAPRTLAAACAGALLGTAGALMQRLTGNPLRGRK